MVFNIMGSSGNALARTLARNASLRDIGLCAVTAARIFPARRVLHLLPGR
jgi:hypothetical protein